MVNGKCGYVFDSHSSPTQKRGRCDVREEQNYTF